MAQHKHQWITRTASGQATGSRMPGLVRGTEECLECKAIRRFVTYPGGRVDYSYPDAEE